MRRRIHTTSAPRSLVVWRERGAPETPHASSALVDLKENRRVAKILRNRAYCHPCVAALDWREGGPSPNVPILRTLGARHQGSTR